MRRRRAHARTYARAHTRIITPIRVTLNALSRMRPIIPIHWRYHRSSDNERQRIVNAE